MPHASLPETVACPADIAEREAALLAPYAMHSRDSQGREHAEAIHEYRGPYQRDRDRILHSAAYRRLSHKTQVFTGSWGDYHRNRLTHTLEVASVSRTLGRALRLNEDLVEALAMLHDIGHPPFGHAGEDALHDCLAPESGFNHNGHALRIVRELERRYPYFEGLNLSREVLEGQEYRGREVSNQQTRPLLEVQVVEAADSVTYDTHDADDSLELGLLRLDELIRLPMWQEAAKRVSRRFAGLLDQELRHALVHELIDWQATDILRESRLRLERFGIQRAAEVRQAETIVRVSEELRQLKGELEKFLFDRVYRHPRVQRMRSRAKEMLQEMFSMYVRQSELLPPRFRARLGSAGAERTVVDYLAGMTDRFARREYRRLVSVPRGTGPGSSAHP